MVDRVKELLKKTKPSYPPTVATNYGWADSKTGELLVAIRDLALRIDLPPIMTTEAIKRKAGRPPGSKNRK
jgi:hypothetical protein